MQKVSEAWKQAHELPLLPETFIEISVGITDVGARDLVTATGENEAYFSSTQRIVGDFDVPYGNKYATLEHNFWLLDGSRKVLPDSYPYDAQGYVGSIDEGCVVLRYDEIRSFPVPGFTITWSNTFGEYPTAFSVTVQRSGETIAYKEITDNTEIISEVAMSVVDYDTVIIRVISWNTPNHRARIDRVFYGHMISFGKQDILSFTHEQRGDLNSGEIPKNSVEFSLNNVDEIWNPSNSQGLGRYLTERQAVVVRYGMLLDGAIEWIPAGTFYLSEWRVPSNGMKADFKARDAFEFMLNKPYKGGKTGTLDYLIENAIGYSDLPDGFTFTITNAYDDLKKYIATVPDDKEYTAAEVIQMCANAACCVFYQDRGGSLLVDKIDNKVTDCVIKSFESYSHPEIDLSKPLKSVTVDYGDKNTFTKSISAAGENQTVKNPLVSTAEQAEEIADWVTDSLKLRSSVSGDFRPDLMIDVFDIITIESKYGAVAPVAITEIKYSFNGAFRATYKGRKIDGITVLGGFVIGESRLA